MKFFHKCEPKNNHKLFLKPILIKLNIKMHDTTYYTYGQKLGL